MSLSAPPVLTCAVCGTPLTGAPGAPCPTCGLPAAGQAALVVARIGVTLTELARDRDALLATLRAAAPGTAPPHAAPPPPYPPPQYAPPAPPPPLLPPVAAAPRRPRRRISPQQVLLGLGALLLVAAAVTFVAVAWNRLGLVFQATVMLVVTAAACAVSAWSARRGLRATEEALAGVGAALLAVDLGAAHAFGLFDLERVPLRVWSAWSFAAVVVVTVLLGRLTRSTVTWPLAALLAAQPLPFLMFPPETVFGPAGVALAFGLAAGDLVAQSALRRGPAVVAGILAAVTASIGVLGGVAAAGARDRADSWTATGIVAAAAVGAVVLSHLPRFARRLPRLPVVALGSAVTGVVVTLSLHGHGAAGTTAAAAGGVLLLTVAVLLVRLRPVAVGLTSAGAATAAIGDLLLLADQHLRPLSLVLLAATVPAALAAVRVPRLRLAASGAALLAPVAAVLTALGAEWLPAAVAGLLLALVAAAGFALAAVRAGASEEWVWAVGGAVATAAAVATTGTVTAWGQVAIDLAVAGVAAGCYGLVCRRRWVQVLAVTALVVASWTAVAGAEVRTPEAYTLPAAAGLLLIAVPQLRSGARSWAAEGPAVGVALVPSAVMVVASPTVPRLVLVVVAGAAVTTFGTLTHRQAPFLLGALSLAVAVIGRLAPYAPLLPRWLTLGLAGLLLLLLGATYERRIAQAREAVTWIAHMR